MSRNEIYSLRFHFMFREHLVWHFESDQGEFIVCVGYCVIYKYTFSYFEGRRCVVKVACLVNKITIFTGVYISIELLKEYNTWFWFLQTSPEMNRLQIIVFSFSRNRVPSEVHRNACMVKFIFEKIILTYSVIQCFNCQKKQLRCSFKYRGRMKYYYFMGC